MIPEIVPDVATYFLMWGTAVLVCSVVGVWMIRSAGNPLGRRVAAGILCFAIVLLGSKALYLLEWALFPEDDYVPESHRGMQHGFRIPGGILLLAISLPWVCKGIKLSWREYGDGLAVVLAVMLIVVRCGCFLNGCCFGVVSNVPWAVTFPSTSWVYYFQVSRGIVSPSATRTLPVHPLQLYFVAAAVLALFLVLKVRRERPAPGEAQLTFYGVFFGSTALLEPFRANYLTLNNWLVVPAAAIALGGIVRVQRREAQHRAPIADGGSGTE